MRRVSRLALLKCSLSSLYGRGAISRSALHQLSAKKFCRKGGVFVFKFRYVGVYHLTHPAYNTRAGQCGMEAAELRCTATKLGRQDNACVFCEEAA